MPKGVEHTTRSKLATNQDQHVFHSLMPKGVEHVPDAAVQHQRMGCFIR